MPAPSLARSPAGKPLPRLPWGLSGSVHPESAGHRYAAPPALPSRLPSLATAGDKWKDHPTLKPPPSRPCFCRKMIRPADGSRRNPLPPHQPVPRRRPRTGRTPAGNYPMPAPPPNRAIPPPCLIRQRRVQARGHSGTPRFHPPARWIPPGSHTPPRASPAAPRIAPAPVPARLAGRKPAGHAPPCWGRWTNPAGPVRAARRSHRLAAVPRALPIGAALGHHRAIPAAAPIRRS